ncbi:MAG: flippase-like domain-containing protein, partial [Chloroflexi bacterium]|nr:flippase-like domain-containing protein [Chloroflexota bacterium]
MPDSYENAILTDAPPLPAIPHTRRQERRWIVLLLLLGLGSTLLLTTLAGNAETFALLRDANLFFVALIGVTQFLRYVAMTGSVRVVAEIVKVRVPLTRMFQVTVAAHAANRTFVGGAAGVLIRLAFFLKRGMHSGTFVAVETIEDGASLAAVALLFITGLYVVLANGAGNGLRWDVIGLVIAGALALAGLVIFLLRRRALVERLAETLAQAVNRVIAKFAHRNLYDEHRVRGGVADFYRGLELAQTDPQRVFVSFCCSLAR